MRAVVQRVTRASVKVDNEITGEIGSGLLVLLGVAQDDAEADADYLAEKTAGLRIFEDGGQDEPQRGGRWRCSAGGLSIHPIRRCAPRQAPVVRRSRAARAGAGVIRVLRGARACGRITLRVGAQAMMDVEMVNSGPVTILLDSKKLF